MICCVTETWVYDGDSSIYTDIKNNGFNFVNQPRPNKKGGGVGILVKPGIDIKQQSGPTITSFEYLQTQCSLGSKGSRFIFCTVYRTGILSTNERQKFLGEFETLLFHLEDKHESV